MKAKRSILIITVCAILFSVSACASLNFDPAKRIYTMSKTENPTGHSASSLPQLLDKVLKENKPVILFVHGRGDEPNKSMNGKCSKKRCRGKAYDKLKDGYDANVLMFNWDSKRKNGLFNLLDRSRPLSNMGTASNALISVLEEIKQYYTKNPTAKKIAFIAHSMGTIVVQNVVKNHKGWVSKTPLFSNFLLSSADADELNHKEWVGEISAVENVYVTINKHDKILDKSSNNKERQSPSLGLGTENNLADKAIYVDLTNLGEDEGKATKVHELFHKKSMHQQVHACNFYHQTLTGQPVVFDNNNSETIIANQKYKLKFKRDSQDSCFK